jgi:hypothetical protein
MPERPRQSDEWLKEQTITWLSRVEVCHVTVLKRHHSIIARGSSPMLAVLRRCQTASWTTAWVSWKRSKGLLVYEHVGGVMLE